MLDDELLLYLIDITLLHLRRKAARPANISIIGGHSQQLRPVAELAFREGAAWPFTSHGG